METGLVIGKFAPYHKGHEALIKFAKERCDQLKVIVCEEPFCKTTIPRFIDENIEVITLKYDATLPYIYENTDKNVSNQWAEAVKEQLPNTIIDTVFSSEIYSKNFSKALKANNIIYDIDRSLINISSSKIKSNLLKNWNFLTDSSKLKLQNVIVLHGSEATGKTTLMTQLVKEYNSDLISYVPEYGRILSKPTLLLDKYDLLDIATEQQKQIELEVAKLKPIVICDTDYKTTLAYSIALDKRNLRIDVIKYPKWIKPIYIQLLERFNHNDPTRLNKEFNDKLENLLSLVIKDEKNYIIKSINREDRINKIKNIINNLNKHNVNIA